jgi:hypothetical protein
MRLFKKDFKVEDLSKESLLLQKTIEDVYKDPVKAVKEYVHTISRGSNIIAAYAQSLKTADCYYSNTDYPGLYKVVTEDFKKFIISNLDALMPYLATNHTRLDYGQWKSRPAKDSLRILREYTLFNSSWDIDYDLEFKSGKLYNAWKTLKRVKYVPVPYKSASPEYPNAWLSYGASFAYTKEPSTALKIRLMPFLPFTKDTNNIEVESCFVGTFTLKQPVVIPSTRADFSSSKDPQIYCIVNFNGNRRIITFDTLEPLKIANARIIALRYSFCNFEIYDTYAFYLVGLDSKKPIAFVQGYEPWIYPALGRAYF